MIAALLSQDNVLHYHFHLPVFSNHVTELMFCYPDLTYPIIIPRTLLQDFYQACHDQAGWGSSNTRDKIHTSFILRPGRHQLIKTGSRLSNFCSWDQLLPHPTHTQLVCISSGNGTNSDPSLLGQTQTQIQIQIQKTHSTCLYLVWDWYNQQSISI